MVIANNNGIRRCLRCGKVLDVKQNTHKDIEEYKDITKYGFNWITSLYHECESYSVYGSCETKK